MIKEYNYLLMDEHPDETSMMGGGTNESTLSEAIEGLRTLQQSYDQIASAAEAYNVGKTRLAAAITSKGVETSPTESYPEMAEKVEQIPQETTIYEGADSYGKQLSADGSLWDLYQVLADMKTRFMGTGDYAALIVCEYYKGYPSLVLQGADGYYTCDGDYYDYASPNHVWHDDDNGKMNRWVCFLYRDEGARLGITNTAISPRSMYIGGHIGTIEYFVNGRLTDLVCGIEETDVLDNFLSNGYTQQWSKNLNLIKVGEMDKVAFTGQVFASIKKSATHISPSAITGSVQYLYMKYEGGSIGAAFNQISISDTIGIEVDGAYNLTDDTFGLYTFNINSNTLRFVHAKDVTIIPVNGGLWNGAQSSLYDVIVGAFAVNLKLSNWNPTSVLADADQKAQLIENIKNGILARVSDATGGTQLVFTVSTNMYNAIASETIIWNNQTMTLADAFLTKNWLLAGA